MPTRPPLVKPDPDDIDAWINGGTRREATLKVCLAGKVLAEYEAKGAELLAASEQRKTMADGKTIRRLTDELEAIRLRMVAESRDVTLRALEPHEYNQLAAEHQPREDVNLDEQWGVNVETFFPELVTRCTVSPALTPEQWEAIRSKMSSRQWDDVWRAAHVLNRGEVNVPKQLDVSALIPDSDETSKQPSA